MGKEKNLKEMAGWVLKELYIFLWPYLTLFIERKETFRRQREITHSWEIIVLLPNTTGLASLCGSSE